MMNSDPDSDGNRCIFAAMMPSDLIYPSSFPPLKRNFPNSSKNKKG